jgi:hypothetical protein
MVPLDVHNQGPLGGLMQLLNAGTAGQLTGQANQSRAMQLQQEQLKQQQAQDEYNNLLDYRKQMGALGPNATTDQMLPVVMAHSKDPGQNSYPLILAAQARQAQAAAAQTGANAKVTSAGANVENADTRRMVAPSVINKNESGANNLDEQAALASARAKAVPIFAQAAKLNAATKQAAVQAKADAATKAPSAAKSLAAAERLYTAQQSLVMSKESSIGDMMKMVDPAHKQALLDELQNAKTELAARKADLDAARAAMQTPAGQGAVGANTSSAGPTPAGTLSTVQKLQGLLKPTPPAVPAAPPGQ